MNELAAKARDGALDPDEELQIESYRSAARLLEILKLKTRLSIQGVGPPAQHQHFAVLVLK